MAAEFASAAAGNTVGNLATEYAPPYLTYFFHFGKIVAIFKNRRNELELKKDRVKNDIDKAPRQTEVIEKGIEEWLTRAEKELGEAQSLEDEIQRKKCFNWCPNWGWRYCLSKKVAKKTLYISQLLNNSNFPRVGKRLPLQGIEFLLPKNFMPSESSKSAFNGIMKALNSHGVNMIGLYGMPGVGKTTLAEVAGKQAREQKLFDKVVIVPSVDQEGLNALTSFHIEDCKDLEYLIDTTQVQGPNSAAFSTLVKLTLKNMICLKELCHGWFPLGFLQKLEKLTIEGCHDLIVAVLCLQNLKEVSIEECMGLEMVFQIHGLLHANEKNQTSLLSNLTKLELFSLPELKCIWKGPPHLVKLQSPFQNPYIENY